MCKLISIDMRAYRYLEWHIFVSIGVRVCSELRREAAHGTAQETTHQATHWQPLRQPTPPRTTRPSGIPTGMVRWDTWGVAATFFLVFPIVAYYFILRVSYKNLHASTARIQVLSTRTAIFLPVYSVIIWLSLVIPVLYVPLQVPTALAEGYCFYCFFAMVVQNLGGPNETIAVMEESGRKPLIACCCPPTPLLFFKRVQRALFHFLVTRTVVVLVSAICTFVSKRSQSYHDPAFLISLILTIFSFALLINGFGSLVLFYEVVMAESTNLLGACKIILLKISVGLIVIQGLIEEFLYAFGIIAVQPSEDFSGQDRAQRFYCFIVLVEYALLSAAVYYAYTTEIKPNERAQSHSRGSSKVVGRLISDDSGAPPASSPGPPLSPSPSPSPSPSSQSSSASLNASMSELTSATECVRVFQADPDADRADVSFYDYLLLVFNFPDVFYDMSVTEAMERPLIDNADEGGP